MEVFLVDEAGRSCLIVRDAMAFTSQVGGLGISLHHKQFLMQMVSGEAGELLLPVLSILGLDGCLFHSAAGNKRLEGRKAWDRHLCQL